MMPSPLSPSRDAVQAACAIVEARALEPDRDDVCDMLAAAYAVDLAPLVAALRPFAEAAGNPNLVLGNAWYQARAVLARSAEEPPQ